MRLGIAAAVSLLALASCTSSGDERSASSGATPPASTPATSPATVRPPSGGGRFADWPAYHGDALRTGYAPTMPRAIGTPKVVQRLELDGAVYASPLVIGGVAIVATENNTLYAVDGEQIAWQRHLGTPVPQDQLPCGNIFPLGITGTPVYRDGIVYAAAEFGGNPVRHELYALDITDGSVQWHRSLDLPGVDPAAMQQRGALTLAGGRVWVAFGGLFGDCGDYKGRLVGYPLDGSGEPTSYTVPTTREAGIWAPPGPVWDGNFLYVEVGNGEATSGDPYDKSDSVLAITTEGELDQFFAPTTWAEDNAADLDLGTQSPAIVGKWVVAVGKRGVAYVLDRTDLGGIGGEASSLELCASFGGTAQQDNRVYVPCTDGIRAVEADESGRLNVRWQADAEAVGSPVIGGGRIWTLNPDAGTLFALDPDSGDVVSRVDVGVTSRFATPAIYGSLLFVPTLAGLTVVASSAARPH